MKNQAFFMLFLYFGFYLKLIAVPKIFFCPDERRHVTMMKKIPPAVESTKLVYLKLSRNPVETRHVYCTIHDDSTPKYK